ncbi:MAG: hypothetical protein FWE21_06030 [Defluviitaleaceae bacterium]|nr:hypothetical protein [Defluviitaleaceae bacterium]
MELVWVGINCRGRLVIKAIKLIISLLKAFILLLLKKGAGNARPYI